jgi:hypothetical protein
MSGGLVYKLLQCYTSHGGTLISHRIERRIEDITATCLVCANDLFPF